MTTGAAGEGTASFDDGLNQIAEETTAADLIRRRGQNTKLRTVKLNDLRAFIERMVAQELAGRADSFTDAEREQIARQIEAQFHASIEQQKQRAAAEEARSAELQHQLAELERAGGDHQQREELYQARIDEFQQRLAERDDEIYELEERLQELEKHRNATVTSKDQLEDEKNRLQATINELMMRSSPLTGQLVALDQELYGGRHQAQVEAAAAEAEDANPFYQDYDVGEQVLTSLTSDLERIHQAAEIVPVDQVEIEDQAAPLIERDLIAIKTATAGGGPVSRERLIPLFQATDHCLAKLSGGEPPDSPNLPEDHERAFAELTTRLDILRRGIGEQEEEVDRLTSERDGLQVENEALQARLGELEAVQATSANTGRGLAETLAALAVPMVDGGVPPSQQLADAVASLEARLAEDEAGESDLASDGTEVVKAMVAERQSLAEELSDLRTDVAERDQALRELARGLVEGTGPLVDGSQPDPDIVSARESLAANLERDPADLVIDGRSLAEAIGRRGHDLDEAVVTARIQAEGIEGELALVRERADELAEQLARLEQENAQQAEELSRLEAHQSELETELEATQEVRSQAEERVASLGLEVDGLGERIAHLEQEREALVSERDKALARVDELAERLERTRAAQAAMDGELARLEGAGASGERASALRSLLVEETAEAAEADVAERSNEVLRALIDERAGLEAELAAQRSRADRAEEGVRRLNSALAATPLADAPADAPEIDFGFGSNSDQDTASFDAGDEHQPATMAGFSAALERLQTGEVAPTEQVGAAEEVVAGINAERQALRQRLQLSQGQVGELERELGRIRNELEVERERAANAEGDRQRLAAALAAAASDEPTGEAPDATTTDEALRALDQVGSLDQDGDLPPSTVDLDRAAGTIAAELGHRRRRMAVELEDRAQRIADLTTARDRFAHALADLAQGRYEGEAAQPEAAQPEVTAEALQTLETLSDQTEPQAALQAATTVAADLDARRRALEAELEAERQRAAAAAAERDHIAQTLADLANGRLATETPSEEDTSVALGRLETGPGIVDQGSQAPMAVSSAATTVAADLAARRRALEADLEQAHSRAARAETDRDRLAQTLADLAEGRITDEAPAEEAVAAARATLEGELVVIDESADEAPAKDLEGAATTVAAGLQARRRRLEAELEAERGRAEAAEAGCRELARSLAAVVSDEATDDPLHERAASLRDSLAEAEDDLSLADDAVRRIGAEGADLVAGLAQERASLAARIEEMRLRAEAAEEGLGGEREQVARLAAELEEDRQRLADLEAQLAQTEQRAAAAEQAQRDLAAALAAAAAPMAAEGGEALPAAVSGLEEQLAAEDGGVQVLAASGSAVLDAMVAERHQMAADLAALRNRATKAEASCRSLAQALAASAEMGMGEVDSDGAGLAGAEAAAVAAAAGDLGQGLEDDPTGQDNEVEAERFGRLAEQGQTVISALRDERAALRRELDTTRDGLATRAAEVAEQADRITALKAEIAKEHEARAAAEAHSREVAEMLAAAAMPVGAAGLEPGEELQGSVAELEAALAEEGASGIERLAELQGPVIAALTRERRRDAEELARREAKANRSREQLLALAESLVEDVEDDDEASEERRHILAALQQELELSDDDVVVEEDADRGLVEVGRQLIASTASERARHRERIQELERRVGELEAAIDRAEEAASRSAGEATEKEAAYLGFVQQLASVALPLPGESSAPELEPSEDLRMAVAGLEETVGRADDADDALEVPPAVVAERGQEVIAAMVAERRRIAETYQGLAERCRQAEDGCRALAQDLSLRFAHGEAEGQLSPDLQEAYQQLEQELDTTVDEEPSPVGDLAARNRDLVQRLVEDRARLRGVVADLGRKAEATDEALARTREERERAVAAGRRLAKALLGQDDDADREQDAEPATDFEAAAAALAAGLEPDQAVTAEAGEEEPPAEAPSLLDERVATSGIQAIGALRSERDRLREGLEAKGVEVDDLERQLAETGERLLAAEAASRDLAAQMRDLARHQGTHLAALDPAHEAALGGAADHLDQQPSDDPEALLTASRALGDELRARNDAAAAALAAARARSDELDAEGERLRGELESERQRLADLDRDLAATRAARDQAAATSQALADQLRDLAYHQIEALGPQLPEDQALDLASRRERLVEAQDDDPEQLLAASRDAAEGLRDRTNDLANDLHASRTEADELRSENGRLEEDLAAEREALRQARARIEDLQARQGAAADGVVSEAEELRQRLRDAQRAHEAALAGLHDQVEEREERIAGLRIQIDDLKTARGNLEGELTEIRSQLDQAWAEKVDVSGLRSTIQALEEQNRKLESELANSAGGTGQLEATREELATVKSENERLRNLRGELEEELGQAKARAEGIGARYEQKLADLGQQVDDLRRAVESAEEREQTARAEAQRIREDNAGMRARLRGLTDLDDDDH